MNDLKLLLELQNIKNKLYNNEKLTDDEYKLFSVLMNYVAVSVITWVVDLINQRIGE